MKKFLLILTLFCAMFSAVRATEVEIGVDDASVTTSTQLPINALWKYGWSQQIYTADEIGMGGTINSITFWMYHTGSNLPAYNINVYMIEVDDEAFATTSSWVPVDEDNLVFSGITFGNLPTTAAGIDEFTLELDEPFVYSGSSNLLIAFANNTGSYVSGMNAKVFGTSADNANMALYKYQDSGAIDPSNPNVTGTLGYQRNAIVLDITPGGSATIPCDKPSGITASDVTAHAATLAWADGSGVYNVEYKKASDDDWTSLLSATTLLTADLTNLEPNTDYQARVQSVCAGNEDNPVSGWKTCSFKTLIGIPYAENFDASSSIPTGWIQKSGLLSDILSGSAFSTGSGWSISSTTCANFDSRHLYQNVYGSSKKHWIMLPRIPMEDNTELTFDLAITRSSCAEKTPGAQDDDKFVVLISTDSLATWTILRQWDNAGSEYVFDNISNTGEEVKIDLSAFAGENAHIALYAESTSGPTTGAGDNYFHIDNILIDYIPRCLKPTDLKAENITKTQAELSWTANSEETQWILEYKKSADSDWQSVNVTANPYTLTNLDAYTTYEFRVAALCDQIDEFGTSKFSNVVSFKTAAGIPFVETFDDALPSGWNRYTQWLDSLWEDPDTYKLQAATAGWLVGNTSGVFPTTAKHMYLQIYSTSRNHWIVTPIIEMEDNVQLTFDLALTKSSGTLQPAEAGQQEDDKFYVLVSADGGETWEDLRHWDNTTSSDPYDLISCTAEGQVISLDLSAYAGERIQLAFYGESTEAGGNNYLHIDNIRVDYIPDCSKPMGLSASGVSSSAATFTWDEAEDAGDWTYGLVVDTFTVTEFVPTDEMFIGLTSEEMVTIDTLQENTPYIFFVRHACEGANSEYALRHIQTEQTPAELPYVDDFENGLNWVLLNGDLTNQWVLGEAAHNGEGTHALYISNDGGTTNAYANSSAPGTVYATKTFNFNDDGTYAVSFDWRAYGESTWDILCVALVPDGTQIEATATAGQWTALPTGWVALHEDVKINLQSAWQHSYYELNIENPGTYKVVMVWRNDNSGGTQPPAAVDNFSIARLTCPAPIELAVVEESATTHTAQLQWTAKGSEQNWLIQYKKAADTEWMYVADSVKTNPYTITGLDASSTYNVRIAAWCDPTDSLSASEFGAAIDVVTECDAINNYPYAENFDAITGTTSGSTNVLPVCWSYINTCSYASYNGYPQVYNSSSYAASGTNSLRFYSYAYSSTYDPQDEYAILPEMEGISGLRMKFGARAYSTGSSYDATFTVGVMSDPADTATFVPVATMEPAGTAYEPFEVRFNTYEGTGKYIAIKMLAGDLVEDDYIHGFYMDDIVIDPIPDCFEPTAVKVVETTATSVQFTYSAEEGDSLSYAIVLKGVEPAEYIGITADTVLVEGLEASSEYVLYVRTECANSASVSISAAFQTKQLPIDLGNSFADDFEGANQWYSFNTDANAWVLGEAAHNGEGTHAMYVSNDGGASNSYSMSGPGIIYATKLFNIANGSYVFQFDWKAKGEGTSTLYDYMRVALVPAAAELAGGSVPTGFGPTALPEGCIAVDNSQALNQVDSWQTFTSNEVAVPAGTYYLAFAWKWDISGGTNPAAAVDNVSITKILCGKPGTPTIEKTNITATSAEIAWEAEEGQTAWQIALDTIAGFDPDTAQLISVNAKPYLAENLLSEHTYYVYVRANCGEDGYSAWSARASFKTAKACQKPDGLEVSAITDSSAVITWNTYGQSDFRLTYGIGNAYADSVDVIGGTYTITGLDENTSYKVKVAAACDLATWSSAKTFKTACSPIAAVIEDFDGITGSTSANVLPDCWSYINGGSSYSYLPTVYAGASYANSGTNSLKFYTYAGTAYKDQYAILPAVNDLNTLRMKFNARKYSASYEATVVVGIMTDPTDGETFVAIDTIRPASIAYEPFIVSFGEYAGEGKYVALKAPLPASSYNGAHIDDIAMEAIPSCLEPTALAISEIGTTSATLDWTSSASQWQIMLNNDTANLIDAAAKPFVLNELSSATNYIVAVRAICAVGDTSAWSKPVAFATECDIIATYPWSENFNKLGAGIPLCWDNSEGTTTTASYKWNYYANTTDTCLRFNSYSNSSNNTNILATPEFALTEPVLFSFNWKNPTGGQGLVMISNDGGLTKDTLVSALTAISSWTPFEINLSAYTGDTVVIYFHGTSNYGNGDAYLYLDDVVMEILPSCPKTTGLVLAAVADTFASFAWDAEEDVTWEYGIVVDTVEAFVPADEDFTGIALSNEATIDTLAPETDYLFFLRKVCGNDKSEIIFKSFSTIMQVAALPYNDDFENGNNWKLVNGACTNAWVVDTAAVENGNALYISNDGGETFAYTVSSPAMVYAVKAFNFAETGDYAVSYDWRANGESTYDYLRVAIVPASEELVAGTSKPAGFGPSALPDNWIAADGGSKLNLSDAWQTLTDTIENIAPGYYHVVFAWYNDNSTGAQSPAAVDNIHIQRVSAQPTAIEGGAGIESKAVKFIKNDHIYIRLNDKIYDVIGRKVK